MIVKGALPQLSPTRTNLVFVGRWGRLLPYGVVVNANLISDSSQRWSSTYDMALAARR